MGFELGTLARGGAVQERTGVLMVDLAVYVGKVFPILFGVFLTFGAPVFEALGDGVPGGSAQVVRKPGALLPKQGDGGLIRQHKGELSIKRGA